MDRIVDACMYEPALRACLARGDRNGGPGPDEAAAQDHGLAGALEAMDRAGVGWALVALHAQVEEFLRLSVERPGRLSALAYYDSLNPERGLEAVRALCEGRADAFVGVAAAFPCFRQDARLKVFAPLYGYCSQRGLPLVVRDGGGPAAESMRPLAFGVLATAYPRLRIVCLQDAPGGGGEMATLVGRLPNLFLATMPGAACGESTELRALMRGAGRRKIMFASGGREDAGAYDRAAASVARLPWWCRTHIAWRTAVRVFGSRILGTQSLRAPARPWS